jgi:hypothetical protein
MKYRILVLCDHGGELSAPARHCKAQVSQLTVFEDSRACIRQPNPIPEAV